MALLHSFLLCSTHSSVRLQDCARGAEAVVQDLRPFVEALAHSEEMHTADTCFCLRLRHTDLDRVVRMRNFAVAVACGLDYSPVLTRMRKSTALL